MCSRGPPVRQSAGIGEKRVSTQPDRLVSRPARSGRLAGSSRGAPLDGFGAWWMVAVLLAFYILSMADRLIFTILVDPIKADLGLSDFQISLILGPAFSIPYAIAGFPLGWMVDRWPRRLVQFGGVIFWSLAAVGAGLVPTFGGLMLARVLMGIGESSATPAALSLISDSFSPRKMTTAVAAYGMGPKLGTSVAFIAGPMALAIATGLGPLDTVVGHLQPWQTTLILAGLPGLVLAFAAFTFREPERRHHVIDRQDDDSAGLIAFAKTRARLLVPLFAGFCAIGFAAFAMLNWVPAYLTREFGMSPAQFGPALGLISLLSALSLLVKGYVVDLLFARGRKTIHLSFYLWLLVIMLPVMVASFMVRSGFVFLALYGVINVVALSYTVYCSAVLQLITPPRLRGRMSAAMVFLCSALPSGLAPMLVAGIGDFLLEGEGALGTALAIVSIGSAVLTLGLLALALKPLREVLDQTG